MQFALPFDACEGVLDAVSTVPTSQLPADVEVVRNPRARRYVIRVRRDGSVRVTVPRHGTKREALVFARGQAEWIARERDRLRATMRPPIPWRAGRCIWLRGQPVRLSLSVDNAQTRVWLDRSAIDVPDPSSCLRDPVQRHLRTVATSELPTRVYTLAAQHGLRVQKVVVRDQRTRWGSCSTSGRISLNWRLIQMPAHVSDYVIVHELMHLRQPNHSRKFWRLVAEAYPAYRDAVAWLRRHGGELL